MYTAIVAWATRLTFLILFATLMEMLLPTGELRRYVKLLLGLVVLVAILHPVMAFFRGETYIDVLLRTEFSAPWPDTSVEQGAALGEAALNTVADALTREVARTLELELQGLPDIETAQVSIVHQRAAVHVRGQPTAGLTDQVRRTVAAYLQIAVDHVDVHWIPR
ncbi:MAG TPA: stage III sporulation protein AF [Firmicutes bacterium]|jgi:stage III sporulation protein AF|nr:stage III sporulation protein AF [Bacillota bacterium]